MFPHCDREFLSATVKKRMAMSRKLNKTDKYANYIHGIMTQVEYKENWDGIERSQCEETKKTRMHILESRYFYQSLINKKNMMLLSFF